VDQDEGVQRSLAQKTRLEEDLKRIEETAVNPKAMAAYQTIQQKLEENKKEHEKIRSEARVRIKEQLKNKNAAELAILIVNLKSEIEFKEKIEKSQEIEVEEIRKSIKDFKYQRVPLGLEIKLAEGLYSRLKSALTDMEVENDVDPRVRVLETARINTVDAERRKQFFAGIAALAALAGVLAMVGLREVRQRRVDSPNSVAEGLGLPIVGMIPRHPSRLAQAYGGDNQEIQAGLIESINCTRTMLLHGEGLSSLKVVQITSPVSGEGKTTLSTHLALSVALAGRRTLLIDGDLRNPNAHRPFNLSDSPGLCELLRGEAVLADVLHPTAVAGLTVMPGGRWLDGTQQTLAASGLEGIFAQVRDEFDFVVVDSSPILPLTDPLLLARHADGVIVSLMQGVSRLPLVEEANQRMAVLGVRVLGAVLNGTPRRKYGYGGSYAAPVTA
jgi:capsular exopolysaccharide synthesis family protein